MITATQVKELRTATDAAMMDCKKALTETNGDMEEAKIWLRKNGTQIADKKSSRETNEGLVGVSLTKNEDENGSVTVTGWIAEVNCETDFVAKNENFQTFVRDNLDGQTVSDTMLSDTIATVGENIIIAKKGKLTGDMVCGYVHNKVADGLGTIGVLVSFFGNIYDEAMPEFGNQIAMHIAASKPKSVTVDDLDQEWIQREKDLLTSQALESGKPPEIVEKMIGGRMKKVLKEVVLLDQPFIVNPDKTVHEALNEHGILVTSFVRYVVGE